MKSEVIPNAVPADIRSQSLRILRCTARALASSPGGLQFKAGARPWLDAVSDAWPGGITAARRCQPTVFQTAGD